MALILKIKSKDNWEKVLQEKDSSVSLLGSKLILPLTATEISGEITLERMKRWNQNKNNTQLWMGLVIEARSDAVKRNIAWEPVMLGMNQGKLEVVKQEMTSERRLFRNQQTKMDWNG